MTRARVALGLVVLVLAGCGPRLPIGNPCKADGDCDDDRFECIPAWRDDTPDASQNTCEARCTSQQDCDDLVGESGSGVVCFDNGLMLQNGAPGDGVCGPSII